MSDIDIIYCDSPTGDFSVALHRDIYDIYQRMHIIIDFGLFMRLDEILSINSLRIFATKC